MISKVVSNDCFQEGYCYQLQEGMGKNFDVNFKPELSPKQMLEIGVFGGNYFDGFHDEYPKDWFEKAKLSDVKDPNLNFFEIDASLSREEWENKGWLHPDDPRGWFQWYCRYYMGRRSEDDERQIKRWKAIQRHVGAIKKNCQKGDLSCRRKQRQALLHWAIDSRKI